ncbi:hypothetical protein EYF80_063005 [Liparis tanakae]|uniref:Uncharacterized protein n=1 Tax=Liparis tanakae TaxID=230148 RepID=A0A4Z2EDQ4_9TELE|nr:hypothetical protein EYF80_063005 [Liparis tanakae]
MPKEGYPKKKKKKKKKQLFITSPINTGLHGLNIVQKEESVNSRTAGGHQGCFLTLRTSTQIPEVSAGISSSRRVDCSSA